MLYIHLIICDSDDCRRLPLAPLERGKVCCKNEQEQSASSEWCFPVYAFSQPMRFLPQFPQDRDNGVLLNIHCRWLLLTELPLFSYLWNYRNNKWIFFCFCSLQASDSLLSSPFLYGIRDEGWLLFCCEMAAVDDVNFKAKEWNALFVSQIFSMP